MNWLAKVRFYLSSLFLKRKLDEQLSEEIKAHVEMATETNVARGMTPDEARCAALREFGNVASLQEQAREERGWVWLEQTGQDLRYALRQLGKAPRFSAVVIATLALGIGANTAVFNVARDVFLRSLPVDSPEELVLFDSYTPPDAPRGNVWSLGGPTFSLLTFEQMREHNESLSSIFAFARILELRVSTAEMIDGECEGLLVTGDFFRGLGVPVSLGRSITAADDRPEAAPVALITHSYWQRRFAGTTTVLGRTMVVNGAPITIIGVTSPEFTGMLSKSAALDLIFPLHLESRLRPEFPLLSQPPGTLWWVTIMGRLKRGVSMEQARTGFAGIYQQSAAEGLHTLGRLGTTPDGRPRALPELRIGPGRQGMAPALWQNERGLLIALGLVGLALLIACANVANLLLARSLARQREIAVRLALGAKRSRLVRQLLTESLVLAGLGGAGGILLAYWGKNLLWPSSAMNLGLLSFTTGVSMLTGLFFGLIPALRATRLDLASEFQAGGRNSLGGTRTTLRLGSLMMIGQVALSCVLLVGTGLLTRTLVNLRTLDLGIKREELLLFRIDATHAGYSAAKFAGLHRLLAERIAAVPGVQAVTLSRMPWLSGTRHSEHFSAQGMAPLPNRKDDAVIHAVAPGFFETMGMLVTLGRGFTQRDEAGAPKVAVINETLAQNYFGSQNPVGRRFGFGGPGSSGEYEIVGVVRDAVDLVPQSRTPPLVFLPIYQAPIATTGGSLGAVNFAVRSRTHAVAMTAAIRSAVQAIDESLPLLDVRTQEDQIETLIKDERTLASLSIFFGVLALTLTCIGLYGLMSYAVERRTNEIGIRMALGARPTSVLAMILRGSFRLVATGVTIGLLIGYGANRFIASLLFGITSTDAPTYCAVILILLATALGASFFPARRAANVEPVVALRAE